jgi:hypothetical protein
MMPMGAVLTRKWKMVRRVVGVRWEVVLEMSQEKQIVREEVVGVRELVQVIQMANFVMYE